MARISLGALVGDIRGKIGGCVFTQGHAGAVARVRVTPSNPRTSAQTAVRTYLQTAAQTWKAFSAATAAAWNASALGYTFTNPISGNSYSPTGFNLFVRLAAKFLQITPAGAIPTTPPATPFTGDTVTVTAVGAAGKITFTGSGANAANVKTELLVQKLKAPNRKPNPNGYRTQQFYAMAGGALARDVTLTAGVYVPAYRFVKTTTGEETLLVVLPAVTVT